MLRITAIAIVTCLASVGCEEEQTCSSVAAHYYSECDVLVLYYSIQFDTAHGITVYCEDTKEWAAEAGCTQQYSDFMDCLGSVEYDPGPPEPCCHHVISTLQSCLYDLPFEADCEDGHDDDGDGVTDCDDTDCDDTVHCVAQGSQ